MVTCHWKQRALDDGRKKFYMEDQFANRYIAVDAGVWNGSSRNLYCCSGFDRPAENCMNESVAAYIAHVEEWASAISSNFMLRSYYLEGHTHPRG